MRISGLALGAVCFAAHGTARADIDANAMHAALRERVESAKERPSLPAWFAPSKTGRVPLIVELPRAADARARGLVPIAPGFAIAEPRASELSRLAAANPDSRLIWAPPRQLQLERAAGWIRVESFRQRTGGGSGQGVVVGIVDTGVDVTHRDLRDALGKTRVRWLLDFSRTPTGKHSELESDYGCAPDPADSSDPGKCAVYDNDELDALIANEIAGDEPHDGAGHGTHVASLAAGNGLSMPDRRYVGIAPEATLIVARVMRADGAIHDADILTASRFVFEQAEALSMPAVVNLSLGSDSGAHDGSDALERGLAELVGESHPGRAMTVAAGNSAGLYTDPHGNYPAPLGTHTEVHVPRSSPVRVPVVAPDFGSKSVAATIWIWVTSRPEDDLRIGITDRSGDTLLEPVAPGKYRGGKKGGVKLTVVNRVAASSGAEVGPNGAVAVIEGDVSPKAVYVLRLEGHGTAQVWIQSQRDDASSEDLGVLLPQASKAGTINIPATHPNLIAVGATLNRVDWTAYNGDPVHIARHGSLDEPPPDTIALFSSAGPTASGWMKPDILAPGAYVVGAMAALFDPRKNGGHGMFAASCAAGPPCACNEGVQCYVTDDAHAVASGTSMATPIVTGAIALLLQQDPTLHQLELLALLQAGARRPEGTVLYEQQRGPGALDVDQALSVRLAQDTPIRREPSAAQSWLALADDFVRPDREWPLVGVLEVRDAEGKLADGFDPARLTVSTSPKGARGSLARVAPGLWQVELSAPAGSGGDRLEVNIAFDGKVLVRRELGIAVDRSVAAHGVSARGGCGMASPEERPWPATLALVGLLALLRRRNAGHSGER